MTRLAVIAGMMMAADPAGLGGLVLRRADGPVFEAWLANFRNCLPAQTPFRPLPAHVGLDRLTGGLDLGATLSAGRPVFERGVLGQVDGGILFLPSIDRLPTDRAGIIAAALDTGIVNVARDGLSVQSPARFGIIARDESSGSEMPPSILVERLAFWLDLGDAGLSEINEGWDTGAISHARNTHAKVSVPDHVLNSLCHGALALGIASLRAPLLAIRAARLHAALQDRSTVTEEDAEVAASLVYASRARILPQPDDQQPPQETPEQSEDSGSSETQQSDGPLADRLVDATRAVLPSDLLEQFTAGAGARMAGRSGTSTIRQKTKAKRGRPIGTRPVAGHECRHLNIVATLRAAAPWQAIRRASGAMSNGIIVRREDFRATRFKHQTETTAIFAVDASGSAALHRLAEAKGAVELLLADCYIRRDRIALVAFRGKNAEMLLPPTRSLQRAKRNLAELPGGGGTPLSAGIDMSLTVADGVRRAGGNPLLVFLTDGKANIARNGMAGRSTAQTDALVSARILKSSGVKSLLIDVSPYPAPEARQLAAEMGATYLALPHADAARISASVSGAMS